MPPPAAKRRSRPCFARVARQTPRATKLKKRARRSRSIKRTGCDRTPAARAAPGVAPRKPRLSCARASSAIVGVDAGSTTIPSRFRDCPVLGMSFSSSSTGTTSQHWRGIAFVLEGRRTQPISRMSGERRRRARLARMVYARRRENKIMGTPGQDEPDGSRRACCVIACANRRHAIAKNLAKGANVVPDRRSRRFAFLAGRCAAERRDRFALSALMRMRHTAHNRRHDLNGHGQYKQNDREISFAHGFLNATATQSRHRRRLKENRITRMKQERRAHPDFAFASIRPR